MNAKNHYYTYGESTSDGERTDQDVSPSQGFALDPSAVIYRLGRIAEEARSFIASPNAANSADLAEYTGVSTKDAVRLPDEAQAHASQEPCALVMVRGQHARTVLQAVQAAGMQAVAPYTDDRKNATHLRYATKTVRLGECYSDALFNNAHAVLNAAIESASSVILLADEARELAHVDVFLAFAAARGIKVYTMPNVAEPLLGWTLCETNRGPRDDVSWQACPHCGLSFDEEGIAKRSYSCPACKRYFRLDSNQRINGLLDMDSFEEWDAQEPVSNPLEFPGYPEKLDAQRQKTGLDEAVRCGRGAIAGLGLAIAVMEPGFFMGSMGHVVGEKISRLFDRATEEGLPVVIFTASGGARMQEGLISLMQMAKVSCAVERHSAAGLLYISVITDPTTGGVTASFATQGDIILAEPGALIGFAGKRVIQDTIRQELPEGFQTAEFALEHGLIDAIVSRGKMRETLAHLIALHKDIPQTDHAQPGTTDIVISYDGVCRSLDAGQGTYNHVVYGSLQMVEDEVSDQEANVGLFGQIKRLFKGSRTPASGSGSGSLQNMRERYEPLAPEEVDQAAAQAGGAAWDSVQIARNTHRPTSRFYIDRIVEGFIELHGDRAFSDDPAIVAGVGWVGGRPVTVIAEEKGADLKERVRCHFGCPEPEGYRKSLRLMRQAEKFGRPIVCLVDTQGAFCGMDAEERGQGNAIADNLLAMAGLRVPVVSILLGEGGSGGALALALSNRVAMQQHAVYSVLSPEGFASILWKDRSRAPEAAAVMRMDAESVHRMGIVDEVVSEGDGPAHENPDQAVAKVRDFLVASLNDLRLLTPEELVAQRQERFAAF